MKSGLLIAKAGASAEKLHRQLLKQLPRVRHSTTNEMVLAQIWQIPIADSLLATGTLSQQSCQNAKLSSDEACND